MGATLRRAGFATATIAAVVACRSLVGIGDAPPMGAVAVDSGTAEAGPDGPVCGIAYAAESCEACLVSSCCAEATACSRSAACSTLEGCMGACAGDPACRAGCVQVHRVGNDPATPALESCLVRSCASPCGLVCGGVGEAANPDAAATCQACFVSQGCSLAETCLADPVCAAATLCAVEATTPVNGCLQTLGDAGIDASAFASVSAGNCGAVCGFYSNWSCVGQVTWPSAAAGDLTLQLSLNDGPTGQANPGVTATVCSDSDVMCTHPSATGLTGADGKVAVVQQADAGPVYANGYLDLSDGGILPELFFWSFPLSLSPASLQVTTVTPAETDYFLQTLHITQDPANGYVYVQGFDCVQFKGEGMTYAVAPAGSSQVIYEQGSTFNPTLTATDASGGAIIVNVPAGSSELTASVAAAGGTVGSFPLLVRAGGITEVWALPRPN